MRLTFNMACKERIGLQYSAVLCLKKACYVIRQVGLAAIGPHIGILFLLYRTFSTTFHTHIY